MDNSDCQALQKQVQDLCDKVDTLQTIVWELRTSSDSPIPNKIDSGYRHGHQKTDYDSDRTATGDSLWKIHDSGLTEVGEHYPTLPNYLTHKDIIKDDETALPFWSHAESANMTPEIQIRRLTAQLTAAYHRIAALEEQIMAQRNAPLPTYDL